MCGARIAVGVSTMCGLGMIAVMALALEKGSFFVGGLVLTLAALTYLTVHLSPAERLAWRALAWA